MASCATTLPANQCKASRSKQCPRDGRFASVNGIVTLGKATPQLILPEELAVVAAELRQLPDARRYRTEAKSDHIQIYENARGNLPALLSGSWSGQGFFSEPEQLERVREIQKTGRPL